MWGVGFRVCSAIVVRIDQSFLDQSLLCFMGFRVRVSGLGFRGPELWPKEPGEPNAPS